LQYFVWFIWSQPSQHGWHHSSSSVFTVLGGVSNMEYPKPHLILPISEKFLAEIGRVISLWAYFETEFDTCFGNLLLHPENQKFTSAYPSAFNRRAKLFRDAASIAFGHHTLTLKAHTDLVTDALKHKSTRDFVAHGRWTPRTRRIGKKFEDTGKFNAYLLKNGDWGSTQKQVLSIETLRNTSFGIGHLIAILFNLWHSPSRHTDPEIVAEIRNFRNAYVQKPPAPDYSCLSSERDRRKATPVYKTPKS
jgi:hypothetical protein